MVLAVYVVLYNQTNNLLIKRLLLALQGATEEAAKEAQAGAHIERIKLKSAQLVQCLVDHRKNHIHTPAYKAAHECADDNHKEQGFNDCYD